MKYMLLIYSNAESWAGLSTAQRIELGRGHAELNKSLIAAGKHVASAGLSDEINTKTVRVRDGLVSTTDGPFSESKEHLAGFYVVDCADIDEAIEICARIPDAAVNFCEVRPIGDEPQLPPE
ncbi:YciI family protein [Nocardiaceae bacterium YC2-7]|uniref:YciI family protein n=2 Tax=Antrihabitans stalactiti TaxID=2584121 RepID=A0A848KQG9_9NOCA|nr:YciI family protein [Antrihabitans stalactiti]